MTTSQEFHVHADIRDNILSAAIMPYYQLNAGDQFYFYLIKDGSVHKRCEGWIATNTYQWELKESGKYHVQAHLKRGVSNNIYYSNPLVYLNTNDDTDFQSYINDEYQDYLHKDLFRPSYPYFDFISASWGDERNYLNKLSDFSEKYKLCLISNAKNNGCLLVQDGGDNFESGIHYGLSGSCFLNGSLIFGNADAFNIEDVQKTQPTGNYTYYLQEKTGRIICGSDYFGNSKIYYLYKNGLSIASNNYHLAIIFAKHLGVNLSMDMEKVQATLVFANMQPFHQNFSHRMDVAPFQLLPVDKKLSMHNGHISIENTLLTKALNNPENYTPDSYQELLNKAHDEINDNTKSVLNHGKFKNIIVDLSGGMDSRAVFCSVTNFPGYKYKIFICSHNTPSAPDDIIVALEINSVYGYKFDSLYTEKRPISGKTMSGYYWSYNLGAYYSYTPSPLMRTIPQTARLTGAYGEICARPYYARSMFDSDLDTNSTHEFCEKYFSKYGKNAIHFDCLPALKSILAAELEQIPGRTPLERFDNHYLFFRNGLHFSDRMRSMTTCPEFGPLQSKSLFAAKMMGFHVFKSIKTQLDITNLLNPKISAFRYESKSDNEDKYYITNKYGILGISDDPPNDINIESTQNEWVKSKDESIISNIYEIDEKNDFSIKYRNFENDNASIILRIIKILHKREIIESMDLIKVLWLMFSRSDNSAYSRSIKWNISNRLASIHMQNQIISS